MLDVFFSYKSEDRDRVRPIVLALREAGLNVWWDQDIPAGAPWEATIDVALAQARSIIVCWSEASIDPQAGAKVQVEAREGLETGRLVQVLLDRVKPPTFFRQYQAIDLTRWTGDVAMPNLDKLREAVASILDGHPPSSVQPNVRRLATSDTRLGLRRDQRAVMVNGELRYLSDWVALTPPIPYSFDANPSRLGFEHLNCIGYRQEAKAEVGQFVEADDPITLFYDYPPMLGPIPLAAMKVDYAIVRSPIRGLVFWISWQRGMGSLNGFRERKFDRPTVGLGVVMLEGDDAAAVSQSSVYRHFVSELRARFDDFQHKKGRGKPPRTLRDDLDYLDAGHVWVGNAHDSPFPGHQDDLVDIVRNEISKANLRYGPS